MTAADGVESVIRAEAPHVVSALVRRFGDFSMCEDATQEALIAAALQWPGDGVPDDPGAWLVRVASRRRIEMWRTDDARRRREEREIALEPAGASVSSRDDSLALFVLCCHPSLTPPAQVALTLRAVGGLTTAEIARALLVPEATVAQRISRAKRTIRASGAEFRMPEGAARIEALGTVLRVLYLVFTEGHMASSGAALQRVDLVAEAIRLTRQLRVLLPGDGEVDGLLALMLLTDARRAARTAADGALIPLAEQDRTRWDASAIAEGVGIITHALSTGPAGPYQLQAAIAAVHDEAASPAETDWAEILGLYELLAEVQPGPMVALNRIVALAEVHGADAGLWELEAAEATDAALAAHYRADVVRAHLLDRRGDAAAAADAYRRAARRSLSEPERRHLEARAAAAAGRVAGGAGRAGGGRAGGGAGRADGGAGRAGGGRAGGDADRAAADTSDRHDREEN